MTRRFWKLFRIFEEKAGDSLCVSVFLIVCLLMLRLSTDPCSLHAQEPGKGLETAEKIPSDVLFRIGKADQSPAEFRFRPDWVSFAAKVPDKSTPVPFLKFTVGKNCDADWTPWHWSTAEAKAGHRSFTAEIEFDSPEEKGKMYLVVGIAHGISGLGSEVRVVTNGVESPIVRAKNPGMVKGP
ncbi:MAG: hypothetical protein J6A23_14635, partial [Thermoguttaceae bacterium]|nr:hypothetical protein [Thermoguttaceae bacterium]